MMIKIDAKGLKCPQPVILTKRALEEIEEGEVEVVVDNYVAKENISRLAAGLGLSYDISEKNECYYIIINKSNNSVKKVSKIENIVIVISGDKMGSGDDALGEALMKSYIYTLTEVSPMPDTVIFLNSGIKLTTEGSPVLDSLNKLLDAGIEIISCGTCLDFYGLKDKLKVGIIGNMYSIAEKMNNGKTISVG